MSVRSWLVAVVGTVFIVFVLPYVMAVFGLAPNGTEALVLVALLWAGIWAIGRRRTKKGSDR